MPAHAQACNVFVARLAHMTLLCDGRELDPYEIAPIQWRPRRCALVLSHVGLSRHERLAEWPLAD